MNKTLMAIVAALCAGCSSAPRVQETPEKSQKQLSHDEYVSLEKEYQQMLADGKITPEEHARMVVVTKLLDNAKAPEGHLKDDHQHVSGLYTSQVPLKFDNAQIYVAMTGVDEYGVPANMGATEQLIYAGTGKEIRAKLGALLTSELEQQIVASAKENIKPLTASSGSWEEGGNRVQGFKQRFVRVNKDIMTKIVDGGIKPKDANHAGLGKELYTKATDGIATMGNGEAYHFWLAAVFNGYTVEKK